MRKTLDWLGVHLWPDRHFERLYSQTPDPWNCETSPYELLKAKRTADAIIQLQMPGAVLDVGCGEGILAEFLGARGHVVSAIDISPSAVERARQRCASHSQVDVAVGNVLKRPVLGRFDVIVLSEVLYYLGYGRSRRTVCDQLVETLSENGYLAVTNPWPASRNIERVLGTHSRLKLVSANVFPDPGRPYSLAIYRRLGNG